jgi:hypothetical protein
MFYYCNIFTDFCTLFVIFYSFYIEFASIEYKLTKIKAKKRDGKNGIFCVFKHTENNKTQAPHKIKK